MNSDNLRILNALKAIADKLGADDKANVSENTNGRIAEEFERIAMIKDLKPEPSGGGGGGGSGGGSAGLVVPVFSIWNEPYTCDKTFAEVYAAVQAGQCVSAVSVDQDVYFLSFVWDDRIGFINVYSNNGLGHQSIIYCADNSVIYEQG